MSNMKIEKLPEELQKVVQFHGHFCPGVGIGYRVALVARKELDLGRSEDEELVAIVENNSCAVDAIQYINGTTFGKGNLIFRDHGLHAYTFIERNSGKQIRIELKADFFQDDSAERRELLKKMNQGIPLSESEKLHLQKSRQVFLEKILTIPDNELFNIKTVNVEVPERAQIFNSMPCSRCGLMVMETRVRVLNRKFYCIPCWNSELQNKAPKSNAPKS
ncbi:MAG: FmdE family protein [Candidatus Helarchaeota archaeon]